MKLSWPLPISADFVHGSIALNKLGVQAWVGKGKGILTLRKPKDGTGRPFVVVASNTGNLLLNASIQAGLKPLEVNTLLQITSNQKDIAYPVIPLTGVTCMINYRRIMHAI